LFHRTYLEINIFEKKRSRKIYASYFVSVIFSVFHAFHPTTQKFYDFINVQGFILGLKPFLRYISTTDFHSEALSLMPIILLSQTA
jgi:hypothetical protein